MIRKICPVCDQMMKEPHYCRNCRSWVKEPYVRDVDYFLNERHPQTETGCRYHQDGMGRSSAGPVNRSQPNRQGSRSLAGKPTFGSSPAAKRQQKKASRGFRPMLLLVAVAMMIFLSVMGFLLINVTSHLSVVYDALMRDDGYDIDLGSFRGEAVPDEWDQNYEELTDDAVKVIGIGCSSEPHFEINGPELADPLVLILESQGYEVAGTNTYSYNEKAEDGDTWYATWMSLDLANAPDDTYRYVELEYDTADERLHQICLELGQEPEAAVVAAEVLVLLEERGAITGAADCGEAVLEPLLHAIERGEDYSLEYGNLRVTGNAWESDYGIVIQPSAE